MEVSLRIALLVAGAVLVGAVYAFGVLRKRHRSRGHYRQRFQPFRPPEQRITLPDDDFEDEDPDFEISAVRVIPAPKPEETRAPEVAPEVNVAAARPATPAARTKPGAPAVKPRAPAAEPVPAVAPEAVASPRPPSAAPIPAVARPAPELIDELPVLTQDGARRPERKPRKRKTDQMTFSFDGMEPPAAPPAPPAQPPKPQAEVLSLVLQAPRGKAITGPNLLKAMNTVGLRYGDMRIFHHFGAGELRTETPLFSVANMFEPGYFDLDNIDALETEGIAFFMQLPSPLDGAVAFELFLNTAQRLAEALKVELHSEPGKPLDSAAIDRMRRIAGRYGS